MKNAELEEQKKSLNEFMDAQPEYENTRDFWRQNVEEQQAAQKAVIENISQEIIEQTDELRKQMLM